MKNAELNWVRLPVKNLENCRELGGYITGEGNQTKWHSFLRSDNMSKIEAEEIEFLKVYGVNTVIDLRGIDETSTHKNPLEDFSFCDYHNIPLAVQPISEMNFNLHATMGDFYVSILEESPAIPEVMKTIAAASEGCVVFHCMAGKDRTGVIAMLLLGIAGVEQKDIISNYEVTYTNLESIQEYKNLSTGIPESYLYSKREFIIQAYEHIINKYKSFELYLVDKGLTEEEIINLRNRLINTAEAAVLQ